MDTLTSFAAHALGLGILAAVYFVLAAPLLIGLLMALKWWRYREWLAVLAVLLSMVVLAQSGDFLYNLRNWASSRFSPGMNIANCVLMFGTPPFLFILTLIRSRRRWLWALGMTLLTSLAVLSARNEFRTRTARDAEAYRLGVKPLTRGTGTEFVPWWRDPRDRAARILLQGHIPATTPVVLLTSPFGIQFKAGYCVGSASTYWPPAKDPKETGNVTELAGLKGCRMDWVQGIAAIDRGTADYRGVQLAPMTGKVEWQILTNPVVRSAFAKFGYDAANFDLSLARHSRAAGLRQTSVFVIAIKPLRMPPNAFPCADPALIVSIQDLGNVKAVLPYCAISWNLFQLDDRVYLAATTQAPTPPGEEIMNPDETQWLFRVEGTELKQLWPAP